MLEPPGPGALLLAIVPRDRVSFGPTLLTSGEGRLLRVQLPAGLDSRELCMATGIAVVMVWFAMMGTPLPPSTILREIARAVVMPEAAVRALVAVEGPRASVVANAFVVPIAAATRRLADINRQFSSGTYDVISLCNAG